jgi:hypothetical protein
MRKFAAIVCLICLTLGMAVLPVEAAMTIGGKLHIEQPKNQTTPKTRTTTPGQKNNTPAQPAAPSIYINGVELVTPNPPMIVNGRTLVPLAAIFNALQISVSWNQVDKVITAGPIWLQIDNSTARVSEQPVKLDVPAQIIDSRTYVPLSFIAASLGKNINWDPDLYRVDIYDEEPRSSDLSLYVNAVDYGGGEIVAQATFTNVGDVQITKVNWVQVRIYLYRADNSYVPVDATFLNLPLDLMPGETMDYVLTFTNVPDYEGITSYDHEVLDGQYVYI